MDDHAENNRRFAAAIERGDIVAASSAYAHDALLQPPNTGAIEGRDQIAAYWRAGLDTGVIEVRLLPSRERRHDGIAVEIGTYEMRFDGSDAGPTFDRGRYVRVHERQSDGSWLYAVEMFSPDLSADVATR